MCLRMLRAEPRPELLYRRASVGFWHFCISNWAVAQGACMETFARLRSSGALRSAHTSIRRAHTQCRCPGPGR